MNNKGNNHNILKGYNLLFYFSGSMIMHEPSEECIVDFWERGILRNLPVSSSNPTFVRAASQLRDSFSDRSAFGKLLHEDFLKLFPENPIALAPAYESKYKSDIPGISGFRSGNVTEFYDSYGWRSKFRGKIADDHLGVELLFLTLLIDKYLEIEDEACKGEMRNEIRRFLKSHILSWVPLWNADVQKHANTLAFKGIGNLILACAEDIFALLEHRSSTPVASDSLKN